MTLHCPQCGYDLHSLRDCLCSECGEPIQVGSLIQRVKGMRFSRGEFVLRFTSPALLMAAGQIPSILLALGGAPSKVVIGGGVLGAIPSLPFSFGLAFVNASELVDRLSFLRSVVHGRLQPTRLQTILNYIAFTVAQIVLAMLAFRLFRGMAELIMWA